MVPEKIILYRMQCGEAKIQVRLSNKSELFTATQMQESFQRNQVLIIASHIGMNITVDII